MKKHINALLKITTPNDIIITGMNFGWEVPGTFDASITLRRLSLVAHYSR